MRRETAPANRLPALVRATDSEVAHDLHATRERSASTLDSVLALRSTGLSVAGPLVLAVASLVDLRLWHW